MLDGLALHFWRPISVGLLTLFATEVWFGLRGTWGWLVFFGACAATQALLLLHARHLRKRGLPRPPMWILISHGLLLALVPVLFAGVGFLVGRRLPTEASSHRAPAPPKPHQKLLKIGDAALDGDLGFGAWSVVTYRRVPLTSGAEVTPRPGARLTVIAVNLVNRGDATAGPFCRRGIGALLIDRAGRRFETIPQEPLVQNGHACRAVLPDRYAQNVRLAFESPAADRLDGLVVWNPFEPADPHGLSYLYFRFDPHGQPPRLAQPG